MKYVSLCIVLFLSSMLFAQQHKAFEALDVFELEYAGDPQISPDGTVVIYRRTGFDIMKDRSKGNLWMIHSDGTNHRKLTSFNGNESQARWSPDGTKIAYVASTSEGSELFVYWVASGTTAKLSQLENSPSGLSWSPDGKWLSFSAMEYVAPPVITKMPKKPKGAKWAPAPRITDRFKHEADGQGYLKPGYRHIYVISSEGGTARKITSGNFNHGGALSWSSDTQQIYFSGNRNENWEYDFRNSEIYSVHTQTGIIKALTDRKGPDNNPIVSPDGKKIAYLGFDDKVQTYQVMRLYTMNIDGSGKKEIITNLDRSISNIQWASDSKTLYGTYDDKGNSKITQVTLSGKTTKLADDLGGTTLGRPYASGSYSVSDNGTIAFTYSQPDRPADLGILYAKGKQPKVRTQLNEDLLGYRTLGKVEELWYTSSYDGRKIQGWIVYPPFYEKGKQYPLLVENHGGPILNYGDRFSAEIQLYAAAGYVVFYPNPRGSTSYGEEFGNLLYNNYPGQDYNDVMDGVDACLAKGITSEDQLYVTGGSAGGIMTAWMIGKNNRFEAAVVAKPVMNWISKTLVADNYYGYANSRYPGQPWENFEGYWKFSPLSLVGNIETPTMVMVGMNDLRTPPSEAKQLYHALKIRKKETVLVEIPEASHGIAARPSNLITKVNHTLAWFKKFTK